MANRTIMLNDTEYRDVAAALELLIEHCNVMLANGPVADSFSARRRNAQATLQKSSGQPDRDWLSFVPCPAVAPMRPYVCWYCFACQCFTGWAPLLLAPKRIQRHRSGRTCCPRDSGRYLPDLPRLGSTMRLAGGAGGSIAEMLEQRRADHLEDLGRRAVAVARDRALNRLEKPGRAYGHRRRSPASPDRWSYAGRSRSPQPRSSSRGGRLVCHSVA